MALRLCQKPYFHHPQLLTYLRGVKIPTPIVWCKQDATISTTDGVNVGISTFETLTPAAIPLPWIWSIIRQQTRDERS